jgi:citrate lyase subunit gamma (acyl carrier protein)
VDSDKINYQEKSRFPASPVRREKVNGMECEFMELVRNSSAGTIESSDILVQVEKNDGGGVELELDSTVMSMYGRRIREVIMETVKECGVEDVRIKAADRGALDCTIRARVKTALLRASDSDEYGWKVD